MKTMMYVAALLVALAAAFEVGHWRGTQRERLKVLCGPYSDGYLPALTEIAEAKSKLAKGDSDVIRHLDRAQRHIENVKAWTQWYLGQPDAPAGRR